MSAFGIEIEEGCVCILPGGLTKVEAINKLVDAVATSGAVNDVEAFRKAVFAREDDSSTGIGSGVAIPHVRQANIARPVLGVGISRSGVDFASTDKAPAYVIVLFAMPADANQLYLGLLAQLMVALKVPNFYERLIACETVQEVVAMLNEAGG